MPICAIEFSFCSVFEGLKDLHTFAPLQTQMFSKMLVNMFGICWWSFRNCLRCLIEFRRFAISCNFEIAISCNFFPHLQIQVLLVLHCSVRKSVKVREISTERLPGMHAWLILIPPTRRSRFADSRSAQVSKWLRARFESWQRRKRPALSWI